MRRTRASRSRSSNDAPPSAQRSRTMRAVRGRGNVSTELKIVKILKAGSIKGWRRHLNLPGHPDFTFPSQRVVLFVDGCFWHGCARCYRAPKERADYWREKVERNRSRDKQVSVTLRKAGWRVIRVWEHDIAKEQTILSRLNRMLTVQRLAKTNNE